jgi:lipopolysaccharide transport system ATP-binding protein
MSEPAIRVENLGKKYIIGHQKSGDLRSSISNKLNDLLGRTNGTTEEFWALRDVSFEVQPGEAVGIIGRNGAGKSTLLKILSRITDPTTGRFEINGRVSSLLEVGTGFHQELTGRENIYLNGTILGMKRSEIKAKFDQIVDFSGVEKFLDTPVKHYSSGMKVRLAFSVAAHLEPEILIVDEVLAVGDAEFQKKCLGKMDEVSKQEGRTVLFVSHNMNALKGVCHRGIVLMQGCVLHDSEISDAISYYLRFGKDGSAKSFLYEHPINNSLTIEHLSFSKDVIETFSSVDFDVRLRFKAHNLISEAAMLFYNESDERVAIIDLREQLTSKKSQYFKIRGSIRSLPLVEGRYKIGLYILSNVITGDFLNLIQISVEGIKKTIQPFPVSVRGYLELSVKYNIH